MLIIAAVPKNVQIQKVCREVEISTVEIEVTQDGEETFLFLNIDLDFLVTNQGQTVFGFIEQPEQFSLDLRATA